jgi:hypothetical protein
MELELFEAFRAAGVPDDKARGAVEAINGLIDRRYAFHAEQLATRADLAGVRADVADVRVDLADVRADLERVKGELTTRIAEVKTELTAGIADAKSELIRWCVGSIFSAVAAFAAFSRLLAH